MDRIRGYGAWMMVDIRMADSRHKNLTEFFHLVTSIECSQVGMGAAS